jgi:hypothetical protein
MSLSFSTFSRMSPIQITPASRLDRHRRPWNLNIAGEYSRQYPDNASYACNQEARIFSGPGLILDWLIGLLSIHEEVDG